MPTRGMPQGWHATPAVGRMYGFTDYSALLLGVSAENRSGPDHLLKSFHTFVAVSDRIVEFEADPHFEIRAF